MLKKIKNRTEITILLMAVIQIVLLISVTPSNSYIIHQTSPSIVNSEVSDGKSKIKEIVGFGINLLIGFLSIKQIGIVSAVEIDDLEVWCCPETENGAICEDIVSTDTKSCSVTPIQTSCDNAAICKKGCCFDTDEGLCYTNTPKEACESNGGEWSTDATCSIDKCRKGCCVLGGDARFTTEKNCEKLSAERGINKDFRQIWNELQCLVLSASQSEGACIIRGGACVFGTEKECLSKEGNFYKGYLCSNPILGTNCKRQDHVGCVPGKNEIYWFDSCGNRENIYSSDKEASWNNGMVLGKTNSCNPDSDNIGSTTCGNCAIASSKCSETKTGEKHVQDGNFICKDLGCKNAPANVGTQDRANGEKWCLYDGYIGDGKDTVGSEDWLAYCHEGEVEIDRCGEHRGSICQEQETTKNGKTFSVASCTLNYASNCLMYNPLQEEKEGRIVDNKENIESCKKNKHCMIKNVNIGDYFRFSMCVPRYPKGADISSGMDENICGMAGSSENPVRCKVFYEKDFFGIWQCKKNCACEKPEFAEKMNDLCISLGDCGSNINYKGIGTNNIVIKGEYGKKLDSDGKETDTNSDEKGNAPAVYSWKNYQGNEKPVKGQHVEPRDIDQFLAMLGGSGGDYSNETIENTLNWIAGISGAAGTLIAVTKAYLLPAELLNTEVMSAIGDVTYSSVGLSANVVSITIGSILTALASISLGISLGSFLAQQLGRSGWAAITMTVAGGITGLGVSLIILNISSAMNITGWIMIAVSVAAILWTIFTGWGSGETRIVEFICQPWQAPSFSNYNDAQAQCSKCNENPLMPCTKYRCESLGQTCKILNENEENPPCESIAYETDPPVLSPEKMITEGYKFDNEQTKSVEIKSGREDGCVQEFTPVSFILKTDESAQCKYSFDKPTSFAYDEMDGEYPYEETMFTLNHTFSFNLPSVDSLEGITEEEKNGIIEKYGDMNMYIRCEDYWGNSEEYIVKFCVNSGPDETAVNHALTITDPRNGATLKYGTTETDLTIWINERAECSYGTTKDENYEDMTPMGCGVNNDFRGWPCSTKLTGLVAGANKFYIKCKDKSGNINQDDYEYTLSVTKSELKIDSILPQGEIKTRFEPISVDLQVKTSGGIDNGKARCYWGNLKDGDRWLFADTFSNVHEQTLTPRFGGVHVNYIECEDDAGNNVSAVGQFTITVDDSPPIVTRAYHEGSSLKLITNEKAKCYYSTTNCYFDLENGTSMTTTFSRVHTIAWNPGITYYVKCKDIRENINSDCAIKIIPSS